MFNADSSLSPAIRVAGLFKAFRRGGAVSPVLQGVELTVERGECVFLVGPSGSGKTTLLSVLGCLLTPDCGEVEILGHSLGRLDQRARARLRLRRIGFVFQRFHLIRGLSALDNVCIPLALAGVAPRDARRKSLSILAAVGLDHKARALPNNLSVGQCQRVALARALAADPDLILADEPTASLDAASGAEVMELLRGLTTQRGKTVVVVTHDPRIESFADRVCQVCDGRIEPAVGTRTAVLSGALE